MPAYKYLPENAKVMDVLCCLVLDHNTVKKIMKVLKQPHSTVSEKLRFLINNKVVKKNKWKFEVNWKELIKLMRTVPVEFKLVPESKTFTKLLTNERLRNIMIAHAELAILDGFDFLSLNDIVWSYFLGMSQLSNDELIKIGKKFVGIKKELKDATSQEKYLFLAAEGKEMNKMVHIKLKTEV